jgi:RNA polymerase sigma-70 factor (ECF subfamily)
MTFDDDSKLARKVQKGDRQAFEVILAKYERPIFSFIYHFFQDRALCEDLTQETFLRAYRFIDSFRPKEKLSTWLFSIAKNLCIDELRRKRKETTVDIDAVDPETLVSEEGAGINPLQSVAELQEGETLRRVIAKLPEKYRTCIILFYFNELSYEEISRVMKISLSNTKILLFRGKKMLLETYRKETGGKV